MPAKTIQVGFEEGLQGEKAALVAEATEEFDAPITLSMDGEDGIDASSPELVASLGAEPGDEITVESTDDVAVEAIATLIENAFEPDTED